MFKKVFGKKKREVDIRWRIALLVSFVCMLILNGLAGSTTIIGGQTTANVSDTYENLFAPIGFTFAIWGVIYILLLGFCLFVWGVGRRKKSTLKVGQLTSVVKLMVGNFIANAAWILAWQNEVLWLSVILIVTILVTLAHSIVKLRDVTLSPQEYALVRLPLSIYFGWISIATVANCTVFLVSVHWNGWGIAESVWTVGVLFLATIIGLVTAQRNNDIGYLLIFVWAFFGILYKHLSPAGFDGMYQNVIIALTIFIAVLLSQIVALSTPFIARRR